MVEAGRGGRGSFGVIQKAEFGAFYRLVFGADPVYGSYQDGPRNVCRRCVYTSLGGM
jgi:hypothetical protein